MKKLYRILAFIVAAVSPLLLFSQSPTKDLSALPEDPRVKSGTLSNGLSYIIIKNQAQKSKATFCVAQKVGTSLENGTDRGSFMLLQQLATKGTRNFEGSAISDYLKTLGMEADNMIFLTGADRVTYMVKDVPVGRSNTIDSSLLILYNWMSSINVDEEDIDAERSTLAGKILNSWTPIRRMQHKLLTALYPDSPYINGIQPSDIKSINTINSRGLRSFYYNWCRPELQCVIVAGDIDPAKMETQIKSVFSTIPKPLKSTKRNFYSPQPFEGVKTFVLQDDEFDKSIVSINLLKQPLKDNYRKTSLPFILDFMDNSMMRVLQDRINEAILRENLPIYNLSISKNRFLGIEKSSAISIDFETLPSTVYASTSFISAQIKKLSDSGVDSKEFAKTVELYWKEIEHFFDGRESAGNDIYVQRALRAAYENYSMASTELQFEIMKQVLFSLEAKQFSEYIAAALHQEDNIVIACYLPKVEGVVNISEERLLTAYSQPLDKPLQPGAHLPQWPSVTPALASTIVSETEDLQSHSKVIVLSNGATIVLKNVEQASDTIFFRAVSKGGFSLIKGASIGNQEYYNGLLAVAEISGVSYANMNRLYAYNHMGLTSKITQNTEKLEGFTLPSGAEMFMQAIYLNMTARKPDMSAFEIYTRKIINDMQFTNLSPQAVFRDSVTYYRNSNKQFVAGMAEEEVSSYDKAKIHDIVSARFSNAADFVFIFAGKGAHLYKDLAVKYIGGLPSKPSEKENWQVVPNYLAKGRQEKRFLVKMNVPRSYASLTLSCAKDLTAKNYVLSKMLETYIEGIFKRDLYTKVPLYNIKTSAEYYPEQISIADIVFETDSASVHSCINTLFEKLSACAKGKLSAEEMAACQRVVKDKYLYYSSTGRYWLNILELKYMSGKDFSSATQDLLSGITKADFCAFVKEIISANRITVVMDGTTADIPTIQLLQENEFIKQFFDI